MKADLILGETRLVVCNRMGMHARAAAKLVLLARSFQSTIRIRHGNDWANASSILELMALGIGPGDEVAAIAMGPDAEAALPALQQLFDRAFDEHEPPNGTGNGRELELCTANG